MNQKQILVNIDHIISIHFYDEKESFECSWVEKSKDVKRRIFFGYREIEVPEHYIDYYGNPIDGPEYFTDPSYPRSIRYYIKKTGKKGEGPKGTLFNKTCIKFVIIGGKYTGEEWIYFDTNEKAYNFIDNIEKTYPGKFLIVKENK